MERLTSCLLCGHSAHAARPRYRRRDDCLVECPACRLLYANPQYEDDELARLYAREYYDEQELLTSDRAAREQKYNRVLNRTVLTDLLQRYPRLNPETCPHSHAPRVLDYGCGPGYFLAECRTAGFESVGIEFSAAAARYARERLDLNVLSDPERSLSDLPPGHFQLITAWQVIEHLRQPAETLACLVELLAPGGVLAIATPSLRCWRHTIERGRWFNLQNLTHLAFFNRRNLPSLLRRLGLTKICYPIFWGGRPGFGWPANLVQYLIRCLGLGSDLRVYAEQPNKDAR